MSTDSDDRESELPIGLLDRLVSLRQEQHGEYMVEAVVQRVLETNDLEMLVATGRIGELVRALAHVHWLLDGAPARTDIAQLAEWDFATHELKCIFAETMLTRLTQISGPPAELLTDNRGRISEVRWNYLSGVTVHDLVARRAFRSYRERIDQRGRRDGTETGDYFGALSNLYDQVMCIPDRSARHDRSYWEVERRLEGLFGPVLDARLLWLDVRKTTVAALLLRLGEARVIHAAQSTVLRVHSLGGIAVADAREFLDAFEATYEALGTIGHRLTTSHAGFPTGPQMPERLVLGAVSLHSPGFWEFVGKASLLEPLRKYLKDRHERKKDLAYRHALEAQRLALENEERWLRIIREHVAIARDAGMGNDEIKALVRASLAEPSRRLASLQDRGLIGLLEAPSPRDL